MKAQTTNEMWKCYIGQELTTLALPDYYANYFGYAFHWESNPTVGLRITGDFGHARYMSFNIYDMVSGDSVAALMDVDITADEKNVNPFMPGINPDATNRQYTVNIFCSDFASSATLELGNQLSFSTEQHDVGILLVVLRYYLPTDASGNYEEEAGVQLPYITAFDAASDKPNDAPVTLPQNLAISKMPAALYRERMSPIFSTIVDRTLRFYRVKGSGQYNNLDNAYLINAVERMEDEVLLINLQAPGYAQINYENTSADVRYWSFNQGNADTSTPLGKPDQEFKVANDGRTYIAMGDESIEQHALDGGYNFMLWEATSPRAVILYRNLVTLQQYPGNIANITPITLPFCNPDDVKTQDAVNSIGPYAPTGKKVLKSEFMNNYGGLPSPGFKAG